MEANHIQKAPDHLIQAFYQLPDKDLRDQGLCIAEGKTVTDRLLESNLEVLAVLCTKDHVKYYEHISNDRWPVFTGTRREIGELLGFKFHRGVLAAARRPEIGKGYLDPTTFIPPQGSWGLDLLSVQEESNVGTLIRSAKAFGARWIAIGPLTGDVFSRKAIRASVGYSLGIPFLPLDSQREFLDWATKNNVQLFVADGNQQTSVTPEAAMLRYQDMINTDRACSASLILGHEFAGHDPDFTRLIDGSGGVRVQIPMEPGVDSLNVAAAGAILMYMFYSHGYS